MNKPLPLGQWLNAPRPDDMPIAWLDDRTWTLGELRHDVTLLVEALRQQEGERWALCFENSYLFIVRCWPHCMPVKPRSFQAIAGSLCSTNSSRCLAVS